MPKPKVRRSGRWITVGPIAALALLIAAAEGRTVRAAPAAQAGTAAGATYRLADTWADRPWQLTAGHIGLPSDVSSAPDGSRFVLDGLHLAVHVFDEDGQPRRVFRIDGVSGVARIDAGWDGTVSVLVHLENSQAVHRYSADGRREAVFDVPLPDDLVFGDIAVGPDGRTYLLAHAFAPPATGYVEVLGADGRFDDRIDLAFIPSDAGCRRAVVKDLDVAADGTLYVSSLLTIGRCPPPAQPTAPPPPTPTPRPSYGQRPPRDRQSSAIQRPLPDQPPVPTPSATRPPPYTQGSGVLVFDANHRLRDFILADADDVAPGGGGPWVTQGDAVQSLADGRRRHVVARPRELGAGPTYSDNGLSSRLDVATGDRALVTRSRCYTNAVIAFGDAGAPAGSRERSDRVIGVSDDPLLQGPTAPIRLAVGDQLLVLEAATYRREGRRRLDTRLGPPVVQRWSLAGGGPIGQTHLCEAAPPTVDIAADGTELYSIDAGGIRHRPDDLPPRWILHLPEAHLIAGDADAGRVAVIDAAARRVRVVGRDGGAVADWSTERAGGRALPVDIALDGDRVYLADMGRNRIDVRGLDGAELGGWSTHDGPRRIAVGPEGHVFVLGRGGWGLEYGTDGTLLASWPLPERSVVAPQDIAVDGSGRVYVSFLDAKDVSGDQDYRDAVVERAGLWVFERLASAGMPEVPAREGCLARPDKTAAPRRLPLGDLVEVTLTVAGQCPGWQTPHQLVIVLDTSHSMSWNRALERAKAALLPLVGALDLDNVRLGLVTFSLGAALQTPLSGDIDDVRARIARAAADGDTLMGTGIDLARIELSGPRRNPDARQTILVVSDGIFKDEPGPAIAAARAAGIEVAALVFTTDEFTPDAEAQLMQRFGGADRVFIDLPPSEVNRLAQRLSTWQPVAGLFETITIVDILPANMRYIRGSAVPPAAFDPAQSRLTWTLGPIAARDGIRLSYRVQPLEPGIWPTNVEATAGYRDALGFSGRLVFPIPEVEVYVPPTAIPSPTAVPPTATVTPAPPDPDTAYLPFAVNRGCLPARVPLDVVLVLDTSSSMLEPAAGGTGTKLDASKAAARVFVDLLAMPGDHVGVATFDGDARILTGLTGERAAVNAALDGLASNLGTRIDLGLARAADILAAGRRLEAVATVVLLTDGRHNGSDPAEVGARADGLKAAGVILYTIGLGTDIDAGLLAAVASSPDRFFASPTTDDLVAIYRQVLLWLACDGQAGPPAAPRPVAPSLPPGQATAQAGPTLAPPSGPRPTRDAPRSPSPRPRLDPGVPCAADRYRIVATTEQADNHHRQPELPMTTKPRTRKFQAETRKLLDLMIHSVYSRKDVFLRELISNASDAIDKVRFLALTDPALAEEAQEFKVKLIPDAAAGTLTVADNGIGMDEDDIVSHLGTIARSGSAEFLAGMREETGAEGSRPGEGAEAAEAAESAAAPDTDLIGQFGVGFYSVFMVADKVVVESQKQGADHAVRWESTGGDSFTIVKLPPRARGTSITLHLKHEADPNAGEDDEFGMEAPAKAFTDPWTLRRIVKQHSDFIAFPIVMDVEKEEGADADAEPAAAKVKTTAEETLNSMRPLWTRAKDEVGEDDYHEFYRHITHDWHDPFEVIHAHIEGLHEYTTLMYIPGRAPIDLYTREHRRGLQLYAKRVFIMEECRELMPEYLRFVRGLVDSPDLPLNISREMVQQDRLILTIRRHLTRRVLDALARRLADDRAAYEGFWAEFGPVLKEGFHYEPAQADTLKALTLFRSTTNEGWTTLAEYAARMPEGQDAIYYLTGESQELLRHVPQIEAFRAKGVEVLLLTDAVDEIVAFQLGDYDDKPLKSVSRGDIDLAGVEAGADGSAEAGADAGGESDAAAAGGEPGGPVPEALGPLLAHLQTFLTEDIEQVRVSKRLTDSAVCVVSPEGGLTPQMEQMMRAMGQPAPHQKRVLEVNPKHPLITRLYAIHQVNPDDPRLREGAEMLLDQALLAEGAAIKSPARFAQRVAELMAKAM